MNIYLFVNTFGMFVFCTIHLSKLHEIEIEAFDVILHFFLVNKVDLGMSLAPWWQKRETYVPLSVQITLQCSFINKFISLCRTVMIFFFFAILGARYILILHSFFWSLNFCVCVFFEYLLFPFIKLQWYCKNISFKDQNCIPFLFILSWKTRNNLEKNPLHSEQNIEFKERQIEILRHLLLFWSKFYWHD